MHLFEYGKRLLDITPDRVTRGTPIMLPPLLPVALTRAR